MNYSFLKFTAFVLFILPTTVSCAQSAVDINPSGRSDSLSPENIKTKLSADAIAFKVKKRNTSALLEWSIEKETDITYFEIERSDDGKLFYQLDQKLGENLSTKKPFSYIDQNPSPVNYYRIKLRNKNEDPVYSKVIMFSPNGDSYSSVQPNPFLQNFTVLVFLLSPDIIKTQLLDMNGKLMRYKSIKGVMGSNKIEFDDVGSLQPGIYMIRIVKADSVIEKRIIKANQ